VARNRFRQRGFIIPGVGEAHGDARIRFRRSARNSGHIVTAAA
jgi:hypothetical protein